MSFLPGRLLSSLVRHWPPCVGACFAALYLYIGSRWISTGVGFCQNSLFDSDVERVLDDMTRWDAGHERTAPHPIFILLTLPWGSLAASVFPPVWLAFGTVVVISAATIAVVGSTLRRIVTEPEAIALTLLYASSASSLFMFSVIETFPFTAFATATTILCVRANAPRALKWGAGVLSVGVLNANIVQVGLAELHGDATGFWPGAMRGVRLALVALTIVVVLGSLQAYVLHSDVFFLPQSVAKEKVFFSGLQFRSVAAGLHRVAEVTLSFCQHVFVAPEPRYFKQMGLEVDLVTFQPTKRGVFAHYSGLALATVSATTGLLCWTTYANLTAGRKRADTWGLLLGLGFLWLLMVVYGREVFLYSLTWTVQLVLWLALGLARLRERAAKRPNAYVIGAIAIAMLLTNMQATQAVAEHYDGSIPCAAGDRACAIAFHKANYLKMKAWKVRAAQRKLDRNEARARKTKAGRGRTKRHPRPL